MNPIESITSVFSNYVNFNGRARRSEFWWFVLFNFIVSIFLQIIPGAAGQALYWIYTLAVLLPSLAVTSRRLHDTDRSAWWMIGYLSFIIGLLLLSLILSLVTEVQRQDEFTQLFWQLEHGQEMRIGLVFAGILTVIGLVGSILVLIFCIAPGTGAPNRYGPSPLPRQQSTGGPGYTPPGQPYTPGPQPPTPPQQAPQQAPQAPAQPVEGTKFCTQCGMQLQPEARFCNSCGAEV